MKRLFVAIDLPDHAIAALSEIQPPAAPDVRLARREQMHLTLCFIGNADQEPISSALNAVCARSKTHIRMHIRGVGRFRMARRKVALWVGVRQDAELMRLQASVAEILEEHGVPRDTRTYKPHITLARCGPEAPQRVIEEFLTRHKATELPPIDVAEISLYSSDLSSGIPVYTREQGYRLETGPGVHTPGPARNILPISFDPPPRI